MVSPLLASNSRAIAQKKNKRSPLLILCETRVPTFHSSFELECLNIAVVNVNLQHSCCMLSSRSARWSVWEVSSARKQMSVVGNAEQVETKSMLGHPIG